MHGILFFDSEWDSDCTLCVGYLQLCGMIGVLEMWRVIDGARGGYGHW